MTQVTFIAADGQARHELEVRPGESFMQAAVRANLQGIEAECGGLLTCATCHVYLEEGQQVLPPPAGEELAMLDFVAAERRPNSRLSCQLTGSEELAAATVRMPAQQV